MKGIHYRILGSLAVVISISTLGVLAHRFSSLDWLVEHETVLREYVKQHPTESWIKGFLIYAGFSLVPGTTGKSVIFGWLFGFWAAVLMVDGALTVAALVSFSASRYLFRESVEARLGLYLAHLNRKLESSAGFYLLMVRLLHAPFTIVNYAAGATKVVDVRTFWWTTQLGLLPGTMVFVFAGTRIPSLAIISEKGVLAILDGSLIAALAATVALPIIIRRIARALAY